MEVRDWLIGVGVLVLLVVVGDVIRRLLRRNRLKLEIDSKYTNLPEPDYNGELPGGGRVRVVAAGERDRTEQAVAGVARDTPAGDRDSADLLLDGDFRGVGQGAADHLDPPGGHTRAAHEPPQPEAQKPQTASSPTPTTVGLPPQEPEDAPAQNMAVDEEDFERRADREEQPPKPSSDQATEAGNSREHPSIGPAPIGPAARAPLDLDRPVPEILARFESDAHKACAKDPTLEGLSATDDRDPPAVSAAEPKSDPAAPAPQRAPEAGTGDEASPAGRDHSHRAKAASQPSLFDADPDLAPEPPAARRRKGRPGKGRKKRDRVAAEESRASANREATPPAPEEVLVITVLARHAPFEGRKLFALVEACGLTFGRMQIYHRHEEAGNRGPVQFSMVNAVQPGVFNPEEADRFSTPGVTFFLTLSEPRRLMEAFDCMLATARCVADNLDGELKDENRSSLRPQTVEHYRHSIRDYERRRLAGRA